MMSELQTYGNYLKEKICNNCICIYMHTQSLQIGNHSYHTLSSTLQGFQFLKLQLSRKQKWRDNKYSAPLQPSLLFLYDNLKTQQKNINSNALKTARTHSSKRNLSRTAMFLTIAHKGKHDQRKGQKMDTQKGCV